MRVTFDCACNGKGKGGGVGSEILGLAWYGLDPIAWRKVRVFLGGKGDIYIPVSVIGKGGGRWWCRWSGHSWVALSDRRFEF